MDIDKKEKRDDDEEQERERRIRLERERETEREERRREREEREFREREKEWEARERAREREREKEKQKSKLDRDREIRDISFDDGERKKRSRDYYRGKKDREKERIEDEQDRFRELQEEEYKRREQERLREQKEQMEQAQQLQQLHAQLERERFQTPPPPPTELSSPSQSNSGQSTPTRDEKAGVLDRSKVDKLIFSAPTAEKKAVVSVVPGFNAEPEVDELFTKKKRKLVVLEKALHKGNDRQAKLEQAKVIIEMIPVDKIKLFEYPIAWDVVDKYNIVEGKMRQWVTKKIIEYLGTEEKTLIDFILNRMSAHKSPNEILDELSHVLEEDAEAFIIKLWRAFIFEMLSHQQQSKKENRS